MDDQKIVIAGAGIGGLTAAIALARGGHEVDVLEQAPKAEPVGAGISLQPNALACLGRLAVAQQMMERAAEASAGEICRPDGSVIRKLDFSNYETRFGYPPCTIARADLFEVLYAAAVEAGASIHFGQQLMAVDEGESGLSISTEGDRYRGDLLIGADGIHSRVRSIILGAQPTRYSGYRCWRGIVSDPSVVGKVNCMREYWGTGARFGCMKCSENHVYWYATLDALDPQAPWADWSEAFDAWQPMVREVIDRTDSDHIHATPIVDRTPSRPWHRGHVVLLGDAAHPMTPNLGQGGAQAIEDAVVLEMALRSHRDIASALDAYESHRYPRTTEITKTAKLIGVIGQGSAWWKRCARNNLVGRLPTKLMERGLKKQFDVKAHLQAL